ncbi:RNA-binding cell elongation regulator Jag/EloR [Baileyella intestinalis]|uniref:RNA-binding cell elongation regulator Jag/EloR n=1 Tax=Baileyella intestinalis TaxID=2606709 RepID=UPI0022DECEAD|nr:RNA-binding cell elongation regulator Jag/EloR [Baileyella intestinalis]
MRSSEKWGVDVDTAVDLALKELKLTRDKVDVEVLEESSSGFLGIGSKLARVRVTAKEDVAANSRKEKAKFDDIDKILAGLPENQEISVPDEIREDYDRFEQEELEDARASQSAREAASRNRKDSKKKSRIRRRQSRPQVSLMFDLSDLEPVEEHPVKDFLEEVADKMGIDLNFSVKVGKNLVHVDISGKDTGTIIGKRGQTLDSIQYLAGLVVNKDSDQYIRVVLDAENYRAKREQTLIDLANRLAGKVERSNHSITLEPMNPYERKVIHATLQNHPKVQTRSEGKDPYRRVIIERK